MVLVWELYNLCFLYRKRRVWFLAARKLKKKKKKKRSVLVHGIDLLLRDIFLGLIYGFFKKRKPSKSIQRFQKKDEFSLYKWNERSFHPEAQYIKLNWVNSFAFPSFVCIVNRSIRYCMLVDHYCGSFIFSFLLSTIHKACIYVASLIQWNTQNRRVFYSFYIRSYYCNRTYARRRFANAQVHVKTRLWFSFLKMRGCCCSESRSDERNASECTIHVAYSWWDSSFANCCSRITEYLVSGEIWDILFSYSMRFTCFEPAGYFLSYVGSLPSAKITSFDCI